MYRCDDCERLAPARCVDPTTDRELCRDCYVRTDYYVEQAQLREQSRREVRALIKSLEGVR